MSQMDDQTHNDDRLELARFLPYRLSVLSNKISRAIAERYSATFQLSLPEWRVMAILGESPNISAAEVADRTAMDKVAVSRAVKSLLECGRVERQYSSEDKRRSVLALSEDGRAVYREIVPLARAYEADLLGHLSASDHETLDRVIDTLIGASQ